MLEYIGRYLKTRREKAGLTQFFVAKKLGYLTAQYISNIERGVALPPNKALRKLIELYDIPEDELFEMLSRAQEILLERAIYGRKSRRQA
jgi:transcriptional regulator with XRE-family HTH domain